VLRKKEKVLKQNASADKSFAITIVLLLCLIFQLPSFCQSANINSNQIETINQIEEKVFFHKYPDDSKEARLLRIEKFIFKKKYEKETLDVRLNRLMKALKIDIRDEKSSFIPQNNLLETEELKTQDQPIDLPEQNNTGQEEEASEGGIVGAINTIEKQVFGTIFSDKPFQARIEALEDKMLSTFEKLKTRRQPLLDRVNYLVQKAGLTQFLQQPQISYPTSNQDTSQPFYGTPGEQQLNNPQYQAQPNLPQGQQTFSIDPSTGFLINQQTGEIVRDNFGSPVIVGGRQNNFLGDQYQEQPQYGNQYYGSTGNPQALPPEFYLNPNMFGTDDDFGF